MVFVQPTNCSLSPSHPGVVDVDGDGEAGAEAVADVVADGDGLGRAPVKACALPCSQVVIPGTSVERLPFASSQITHAF